MSHLNDEIVAQTATVATVVETKTIVAAASTKDAGRVKIGGGAIRYAANTKDAGRVKIGGGAIRYATNTKDAGRVKIGGGAIRY